MEQSPPAPLLVPACALALGAALGPLLLPDPRPLGVGLAGLLLLLPGAPPRLRLALWGALALVLGGLRGLPPGDGPPPIGQPATWVVELVEDGTLPAGREVSGVLVRAWLGGDASRPPQIGWVGRSPVRLRLQAWPEAPGRSGDRWLVRGRLGRRGASLRVRRPADLVRLPGDRLTAGPARLVTAARHRVREGIDRASSGRLRPLFLALALGERSGLDPDLREAFARTGTAHLLAISGLHVGGVAWLIASLGCAGMRRIAPGISVAWAWSGGGDRVAWLGALLGASAYVLLAGAPVSARRALVMVACVVLARLVDRSISPWNALAAAVLGVVLADPSSARSLGFLLSVSSVAGLVAMVPLLQLPVERRIWRLPWALLATSIAATLATAPLCAWAFGRVPVAGVWVNTVAVPLLGSLTVPPLLLGAALSLGDPAWASPALWMASWPAELGIWFVQWTAEPSRCPVWVASLDGGSAAGLYALGALTLWGWRRG